MFIKIIIFNHNGPNQCTLHTNVNINSTHFVKPVSSHRNKM